MRAFLWISLMLCAVVACSTGTVGGASCDPATCQQQCEAHGAVSGTCLSTLCMCQGNQGGAGGAVSTGASGGATASSGEGAAGGVPDAGPDADPPDASCDNPACGLTDCNPAHCEAPCSTECVSQAEECNVNEQIYLCCITSCNNGSEACDDEAFTVPDETVDPDGIFYLVCADGGGGLIFLSTTSGDCPDTNINRCQCYADPPNDAIANAFVSHPCDAAGQRFAVDLSAYRGTVLYAGATAYPDGTGMGTRICLQGS